MFSLVCFISSNFFVLSFSIIFLWWSQKLQNAFQTCSLHKINTFITSRILLHLCYSLTILISFPIFCYYYHVFPWTYVVLFTRHYYHCFFKPSIFFFKWFLYFPLPVLSISSWSFLHPSGIIFLHSKKLYFL